ncbi:MAG: polysaccharide deacetylase family protein [Solirubrobacterales bacterium]|nr:polysaccharide deacetylase family protein [Solirubrobacterales bacterium]
MHASRLTQSGQQLAWTVELDHPFSAAGLARDHRSLCLLIERERSGSVAGQLCVQPPARGQHEPSLVYSAITSRGPVPGRAISATISRAGATALSATFLPSAVGIGYRPIRWQVISTLRPPACVPPVRNRVGCYSLFPASPAPAKLHTPQLIGCVPSGAPFVSGGPSSRREIALTFDDGPWPDTPQFLDILEREHVVATFFEIGNQIATYGEGGALERRMLADGDMVGDHTWSHPDVSGAGDFARGQILAAAGAIRAATRGFTPCLFRAPYGSVSGALISEARSLGFTTIQWNVDPSDWARPGTEAIYNNVVANAHSGAIVIQHDGGGDRSETLAALPREIDTLRSEGYRFVTVTQLLGQRLIYR